MNTLEEDEVQELLRTHARQALGREPSLSLAGARLNPTCGDRVVVKCTFTEAGLVLRWNAEGCLLMQAGASLLATTLSGLQKDEARSCLLEAIDLASSSTDESEENGSLLKRLVPVLRLMQARPNRRECFLLAWRAALECLSPSSNDYP